MAGLRLSGRAVRGLSSLEENANRGGIASHHHLHIWSHHYVLASLPCAGFPVRARRPSARRSSAFRDHPSLLTLSTFASTKSCLEIPKSSIPWHGRRAAAPRWAGESGSLLTNSLPVLVAVPCTYSRLELRFVQEARISAMARAEEALDRASSSCRPVLVVADDNFYYRSMRYEYFKLARKRGFKERTLQFWVRTRNPPPAL